MNDEQTIHRGVLSEAQKELLPRLRFLTERGLYLAGGTALALQLGHRTSFDFGFYHEEEFDGEAIAETAR